MRFRVPLLLLALVSAFLPLAAQQSSPTSLQGAQLLQQAVNALVAQQTITDVTLSGTARRIAGSNDETGTVAFKALSTGAARSDFSYPSGPLSEIREDFSAGPLGAWSGPDGASHPIAFHNLANRSSIFPVFALTNLSATQNFVVTLLGEETKAGHSVYHLSALQQFPQMSSNRAALAQHLTQIDFFVDAATFLPVAFDFNIHPDDDAGLDIPVELLFSDYRTISGIQIPFHIQRFLNNGLILDLQIQNAAINSGLLASQFTVQAQ